MFFRTLSAPLNPVIKVGEQIAEAYLTHNPGKPAKEAVSNALRDVLFDNIDRIYNSYPHQLSGGQRQRIALAMAIINKPKILLADEPTTALDVTIQKEVLDLIDKLKSEFSLTVIFITHNLALAYERSTRIAVMKEGKVVELGSRENIFKNPIEEYTKNLINAIPQIRHRGWQAE